MGGVTRGYRTLLLIAAPADAFLQSFAARIDNGALGY
jgi:hypothetical protein